MIKAQLNSYRQSPRKVRLVADMVRGKSTEKALAALSLLPKRASAPLSKLIESAVANAKNQGLNKEKLFINEIRVDGGAILYRRRPMSRGRAFTIRKRTSRISLVLTQSMKSEARSTKSEKETHKK